MKHSFSFLLLVIASSVFAQSKLPIDAVTGKVAFKTTIPLRAGVSNEAAFALAEEWFSANNEQFNRSNSSAAVASQKQSNSRGRADVEKEFENRTPLQALDPASNRLVGKVILKYDGTAGHSIQHLYVQYSLILQIENSQLLVTACEVSYNHFNRNNYQPQRFLNFSNSNTCDAVNYMEYLMDCEQSHGEFVAFYDFFNADVKSLFNNLDTYMKGSKALTYNSSPSTASEN